MFLSLSDLTLALSSAHSPLFFHKFTVFHIYFCYYNNQRDNQLPKRKATWLTVQRFQSLTYWLDCFRPTLRQHIKLLKAWLEPKRMNGAVLYSLPQGRAPGGLKTAYDTPLLELWQPFNISSQGISL